MDNKKDIEVAYKDSNPIDFFSKDEDFVFVYKKTEKLATALYMVTNLFSDSEPIKWTLRKKVSNLLSFIIGSKDFLESIEGEFFYEIKIKILEIVSLLEVSFQSGLVSPMNFSILKSEFMHILNFLFDFKKIPRHHMDLTEKFFEIQKMHGGGNKGEGGNPDHIGHAAVLNVPKRTNRQNIILSLLKRKEELTINDIALTIKDCSEKTIQRELISLIEAGIVKKIGERRWSRYSLTDK